VEGKLIGEKEFRVLACLLKGRNFVSRIADSVGLPQPWVSSILTGLKARGFVKRQREGNRVYYSLTPEGETALRVLQGLSEVEKGLIKNRSYLLLLRGLEEGKRELWNLAQEAGIATSTASSYLTNLREWGFLKKGRKLTKRGKRVLKAAEELGLLKKKVKVEGLS